MELPRSRSGRLSAIAVAALILLSAGRVVSTYHSLSQFYDEPYHVASGLEWWQNGVHHVALEHPPLSQIFVSALLYFRGVRASRFEEPFLDGNDILAASGQYARNLALARLGMLPFWIVSCLLVFAIGRRLYGGPTALLALLLYTTLPPVLGYAGLAYTDMALVAAMLCFAWRWAAFLRGPGFRNGLWLGMAIALAVLCKYSAIPYIGATALLTAPVAMRGRTIRPLRGATLARSASLALCIGFTAFVFTWACFRFSLEPLASIPGHAHPGVDRRLGQSGFAHRMAYLALDTPVPLAEVFRGVQEVYRHTQAGHSNYIFGKVRQTGVFYYYPALLVFSVPVGLLALSVLGAFGLKRAAGGGDALTHWAMLAVAAAVSLVNVFSSINIGFRHGLVLYPFVCLVGAVGCAGLWRRRRLRAGARLLAVALVGQHLVSSALAHPDYATYFNVLAGSKPEEICAMSREGGDEWRLASRLRQLGAQHVCLALGPPLPLDVLGLPPYTLVHRNTPCQGWVAVGQNRYFVDLGHSDPGIEWLAQYQPVERIGTSILLYRTR